MAKFWKKMNRHFDSTRSTWKYQELPDIPGSTRKYPYPEVPGSNQEYPEVSGSTRKYPEFPGCSLEERSPVLPQRFFTSSWKFMEVHFCKNRCADDLMRLRFIF